MNTNAFVFCTKTFGSESAHKFLTKADVCKMYIGARGPIKRIAKFMTIIAVTAVNQCLLTAVYGVRNDTCREEIDSSIHRWYHFFKSETESEVSTEKVDVIHCCCYTLVHTIYSV